MATRSQDLTRTAGANLTARFKRIRAASLALCRTLETEDYVVQAMPSVSPTKWHLAHTTWFFEQFVLVPAINGYEVFDDRYHFLFNSYYLSKGQMHPRPGRGLLTRPTVAEIVAYRQHVDEHVARLLEAGNHRELDRLIELGTHHEQQHQELMLTDIKYNFWCNPLRPALIDAEFRTVDAPVDDVRFLTQAGGLRKIGADSPAFCFDNETPRHDVFIQDFGIADRLATNREYRRFVDDGGYREPGHWLSDGWAWREQNDVEHPLYWNPDLEHEFTLSGERPIDPDAPVSHVSFYEADAFARWAGFRLPTEAEWETVAERTEIRGTFVDDGMLHPQPLQPNDTQRPAQLFGDVWEWTSSPYSPYPGFRPLEGSVGEYNGKFMCNQVICRGGSCATPTDHVRATYRNFFYPHERWQFFGIRLARDI